MPDSGTKLPHNRIHLFDPVGLINDGFGGYRAPNPVVRPRKTAQSYDGFPESNTNGGPRSYDSFTLEIKDGGLRAYDHSHHNNNKKKDNNLDVDPVEVGSREIPMYTVLTVTDATYDLGIKDASGEVLRLGVDAKEEDEDDDSTPRLWKPTSPKTVGSPLNPSSPKAAASSPTNPTSPKFVNSSPFHPSSPQHPNHHHNLTMSTNSRTQAIARGRKELMEMVRDLPETYYELSLKDIVEQKPDVEVQIKEVDPPPEEKKPVKETTTRTEEKKRSGKKGKKSEKKKKMARSRSVDNGKFLLKTSVFPILLGSRKSKKSLGGSASFKIAPVPKPQPTSTRSIKGGEKEWWRRRSCISSESDESNGLSSNSTSSGSSRSRSRSRSSSRSNSNNSSDGRRTSRFLPTCCFFNGRSVKRIRGKK